MISIVACTMRTSYMENLFNNYERQEQVKKEMIVILNKDNMDLNLWKKKAREYKDVTVYQVSEEFNLGKCLNYGIGKAKYDIVAKFDDDDYYAPSFLKEAITAMTKEGASIIGKHTSYIYFADKKALMLFREGNESQYVKGNLKGGTLVFHKSVWDRVKFSERRVRGCDASFLRKCAKRKLKFYSVSKYNYVCVRRSDLDSHTQKTATKKYMAKCKLIAYTDNYIPFITKQY